MSYNGHTVPLTKKTRRSFTLEYKLHVLDYLSEGQRSIRETADHFGIDRKTVKQWRGMEDNIRELLQTTPNLNGKEMKNKRKLHPGPPPAAQLHRHQVHFLNKPQAILVDIYGTIIDWQKHMKRIFQLIGKDRGISRMNWQSTVDLWRQMIEEQMEFIRNEEKQYTCPETLHRDTLTSVLIACGIDCFTYEDIEYLLLSWQRMKPFEEVANALQRLRHKFFVVAVGNVDVSTIICLSKYMGISWDAVLGTDILHHYKPDPQAYFKASELVGIPLEDCMVMTSMENEIHAARLLGMKTCFVHRRKDKQDTIQDERCFDFIDTENTNYIVDNLETAATIMNCKPIAKPVSTIEWRYLNGNDEENREIDEDEPVEDKNEEEEDDEEDSPPHTLDVDN